MSYNEQSGRYEPDLFRAARKGVPTGIGVGLASGDVPIGILAMIAATATIYILEPTIATAAANYFEKKNK